MTVRETLAFSARVQGIGAGHAELLLELSRREKEANIKPDPVLDLFMKAAALDGQEASVITDYIIKIVGAENLVLISAAEQIFGTGGKRLRPALVFLVSRATADLANLKELTPKHRRLAEVIEMIHTASLIHDDVLDNSSIRRGTDFQYETHMGLFGQ
ncbi:hypothetical protein Sjap_008596 [Stephania japonica]|uniref:Uncharacterized protein n=1 Tax=Stephania japonica TaxID=461633 RepID=A0AAP0JS78_9MAGN